LGVATSQPLLRVKLLGHMAVEDNYGKNVLPRSRKTRALLAILALAAPQPVLRSQLTTLLWSQRAKEQAYASLRQAVHELQRILGPLAANLLRVDRLHLALHGERLSLDVSVLASASAPQSQLVRLFQLPLLEDLYGVDPAFDRWIANEQKHIKQKARSAGEAALVASSDATKKIDAAERLLSIDPLHEEAWRALIIAYLDKHDQTAARLIYGRYAAAFSHAGLIPAIEMETLIGGADDSRPSSGAKPGTMLEGVRLIVAPLRTLDSETSENCLPGLVEDIVAAVSRLRWISCVAAQSGRSQDIGGDYRLDSALQRSGRQLRATVRLVDLHAGGAVVWARTFDREIDDILALQNELAGQIAAQIDPELLIRQGERMIAADAAEPTALDLTLRAVPAIYRLEPKGFHAAGKFLAAATALDHGHAAAHAWWAYWHLLLVGQAWAKDPRAATFRAGELAERAVTLDPGDARAITLVGHVRGYLYKQPEEALALHGKALSLNPNLPLAWCFSGLAESYLGHHEAAIEQIKRAYQLAPHDPHAFFFDMAMMMPHYMRHEFDQAATLGRRAVELNPGFSSTYKGYLASLGYLGSKDEAARVLSRLIILEPNFSIKEAMERSPIVRHEDRDLYAEGLRRGGLRES
jgi:DNA-binding SARP family transcriptional activator